MPTLAQDEADARRHDERLWRLREARDRAADAVPEWERLRELAEGIRAHALSALPSLLPAFERNATAAGAAVHWARTAEEHNRTVRGILSARGVTRVVKARSPIADASGLARFLEARRFEVVDADRPPAAGADLRERLHAAQAGLTGVDFAIADTGALVLCSAPGAAALGAALPPIHVVSMGLEEILPGAADLPVFLRLLARSASGRPVDALTAHLLGPRPGGELHVVIVDDGRSALLAREPWSAALRCIRCGACRNTCPVHRRASVQRHRIPFPGPIDAVLAPHRDPAAGAPLPFASTLCGSCADVCPVRIALHHLLLAWRRDLVGAGRPAAPRIALGAAAWVLRSPTRLERFGRVARSWLRAAPRVAALFSSGWSRQRELPPPPFESFRARYRRTRGRG